jgi:hypothetical protein
VARQEGIVCAVPKGFTIEVQTLLAREKSHPLVKWWGGGCVTTRLFPCESPHASHGAPALENGMSFLGRVYAASVPHHNQVLQLYLGS